VQSPATRKDIPIFEDPIYSLIGINKISDILVFFLIIKTIEGEYVTISSSAFMQKMIKNELI